MATVKAIVRSSKKNAEVNVRFRVSDGRDIQLFHSSDIKVKVDVWDNKSDCIKTRVVIYHWMNLYFSTKHSNGVYLNTSLTL